MTEFHAVIKIRTNRLCSTRREWPSNQNLMWHIILETSLFKRQENTRKHIKLIVRHFGLLYFWDNVYSVSSKM